jgi:tripartite ATP-independent transporter DctP family solute receptor
MNRLPRRDVLIAGAAMLAAPFIARGQGPIELKLGHVLSETSTYHVCAMKLAELVAARTSGRVKISIFPNSALGGEVRLVQTARQGGIDLFFTSQPVLENTIRELTFLSLPYLFDSVAQATATLQGPFGARLLSTFEPFGLIGLSWFQMYERSVTSNRPFTALAEAKGLKIRVIQAPGYVETYKRLGMQPTPTAYSELFLALQNGIVDGAEMAPEQVVSDRFIEVMKNYVMTKTHQLPSLLVASSSRFNSLPNDAKEAIRASVPEAIRFGLAYSDKLRAESWAEIRKRAIPVIEPDLAAFKARALEAHPAILAGVPNAQENLRELETAKRKV